MSFGWSAGDLAHYARLCVKIHRFSTNANPDVKDVLDRFDYTGKQLTSLEDVLNETGWKPYPFASELKNDLEEHYYFFTRLPSPFDSAQGDRRGHSTLPKPWDKAKLAWRLKRITTNIEDHRARLNEFKQDVVLQIVLQKSFHQRFAQGLHRGQRASSESLHASTGWETQSDASDPISVLSKAQESLSVAVRINHNNLYSHSRFPLNDSLDSTPESLGRAQECFRAYVKEVVEAAESGKLYAKDVSLSEHVDQLIKIGHALDSIREKILSGSPQLTTSLTLLSIQTSPKSFAESILNGFVNHNENLRSLWQDTPPSSLMPAQPASSLIPSQWSNSGRWESSNIAQGQGTSVIPNQDSIESAGDFPSRRPLMFRAQPIALPPARHGLASSIVRNDPNTEPEQNLETNTISSSSSTTSLRDPAIPSTPLKLSGKAYIGGHRLLDNSIIERRLVFSTTEASACIQAHPSFQGMTPSRLFSNLTPEEARVFRHAFERNLDAFPRTHHPYTEHSPAHRHAPYTINFLKPQILNIEGDPKSDQPTSKLQYLFEQKPDRDLVRELIFGRRLLASAGVQQVYLKTKICDMECISLWQHDSSENADGDDHSASLAVTIPVYSKRNLSTPERIVEYTVIPHPKLYRFLDQARGAKKYLTLEVQPATIAPSSVPAPATISGAVQTTDPSSPQSPQAAHRVSSIFSSLPQESAWSRFTPHRRRSSVAKNDMLHIAFSEDSMEGQDDKSFFISKLEEAMRSRIPADAVRQPDSANQKVAVSFGKVSLRKSSSRLTSIVRHDNEVSVQGKGIPGEYFLRSLTPAKGEANVASNTTVFPQVGSLSGFSQRLSGSAMSEDSSPFLSNSDSDSSYFSCQNDTHQDGSGFSSHANRDLIRLTARVCLVAFLEWIRISVSRSHAPNTADRASSSSSGTGTNATTSTSLNTRRKLSNSRRLDKHEDEDASRPGKWRKTCLGDDEAQEGRSFACPFHKRDEYHFGVNSPATQYSNCGTCSFINIGYLKQHLQRVHYAPEFYCLRCCRDDFSSQTMVIQHSRTVPSCEPRNPPLFQERISPDIAKRLKLDRKNVRGTDPVEYWYQIFDTLFPGFRDLRNTSPYYEGPFHEHQNRFLRFCKTVAPELLAAVRQRFPIDQQQNVPENDRIASLFVDMLQEAVDQFGAVLANSTMLQIGVAYATDTNDPVLSSNDSNSFSATQITSRSSEQVQQLEPSTSVRRSNPALGDSGSEQVPPALNNTNIPTINSPQLTHPSGIDDLLAYLDDDDHVWHVPEPGNIDFETHINGVLQESDDFLLRWPYANEENAVDKDPGAR